MERAQREIFLCCPESVQGRACQPLPSSLAADPARRTSLLSRAGLLSARFAGRAWLHLLLFPELPTLLWKCRNPAPNRGFLDGQPDACLQLESSRWEYLMADRFFILHHWRCQSRHRHPGALACSLGVQGGDPELLKVGVATKNPGERRACSFLGRGRLLRGLPLRRALSPGT